MVQPDFENKRNLELIASAERKHIPSRAANAFATWFLAENKDILQTAGWNIQLLAEEQRKGHIQPLHGYPTEDLIRTVVSSYEELTSFLQQLREASSIFVQREVKGGWNFAFPSQLQTEEARASLPDGDFVLVREKNHAFTVAFEHHTFTPVSVIDGYGQLLNSDEQRDTVRGPAQRLSLLGDVLRESLWPVSKMRTDSGEVLRAKSLTMYVRDGNVIPVPAFT